MNKLFATALLAGASLALRLADAEDSYTVKDILELATKDKEDAQFDEAFIHNLGPEFDDKPKKKDSLA